MDFSNVSSVITTAILDVGHSITYAGNSVSCVVGKVLFRDKPELAGIWEDNDIEIFAVQSAINPALEETIEHNSHTFRIKEIATDNFSSSSFVARRKTSNEYRN